MKVELTKEELHNLRQFLERVELKGITEAMALVIINNKLVEAKEDEDGN